MSDRGPDHMEPTLAYYGTYSGFFRVHAHQLVALGYENGRRRIRGDAEEEPSITSFIHDAIEDRLRDPSCPSWCRRYSVKENPPVRHGRRTGKSKLKPDLIIEGSAIRGRPEYVFEAKRLGASCHGALQYTGADGMGCFISGTYAARYDEAGMLGYVQRGSISGWRDELKDAIDDKAVALSLWSPQRDEAVVDAFPLEWVSEHDRHTVGHPVSLRHILLDCRLSPEKGQRGTGGRTTTRARDEDD